VLAVGDDEPNAWGYGFASSSAAGEGTRTGGCRVLPALEFRERGHLLGYNVGELWVSTL